MTTITASTLFTIQAATAELTGQDDLVLLPENDGSLQLRRLIHPTLGILDYEENPDRWENFDTAPLTARPLIKSEMTLAGNANATWPGYIGDRPVREIWGGSENMSRMTIAHFRQLWNFYYNRPTDGSFVEWYPQDRTSAGYNVIMESLTVGGSDMVVLHDIQSRAGYISAEVTLTLRIIEELP